MTESVTCSAQRRGRVWTASLPDHGVYAHGRTLKLLQENVKQALDLCGVDAEVAVVADTPQLEAARAVYHDAIGETVEHLWRRRATLRDIATATGLTAPAVRRVISERQAVTRSVESVDAEGKDSVRLL